MNKNRRDMDYEWENGGRQRYEKLMKKERNRAYIMIVVIIGLMLGFFACVFTFIGIVVDFLRFGG